MNKEEKEKDKKKEEKVQMLNTNLKFSTDEKPEEKNKRSFADAYVF